MQPQHPPINPAHPILDPLLAAARQQAFGNGGEEGFESAITERFRKGFVLPWGIAVWKEVLSGRWGLGRTERQVAERLGLDRRRAYTGLQEGTISTQVLVLALAAARREPECLPKVKPLRGDMVRSGYIDAIEYARAKWRGLDVRRPPPLDPWDYELLLLIQKRFDDWYPRHWRFQANGEQADPDYQRFAARLVSDVLASPNLFPAHCDAAERASGQAALQRIANPNKDPAGYLEGLVKAWEVPWLLAVSNLYSVREIIP